MAVKERILRNKTWQLVVVFNRKIIPLALVGYEIIIAVEIKLHFHTSPADCERC